ncbi:MAG TPA: transglutaminase-like domain-containing protein, partial [Verrucomicrobiae bacterium]|nr:transglutaminase-like domain-containing protein [Verrucomicrobiae bacterium]
HLLSSDAILRRHVHEIIRHFERQAADDSFLVFCLRHGDDFNIEEAAWLLARTQYPDINVEAYQALLDNYAEDLCERIEPGASARQTLADLNTYLFDDLGFSGNEENYYDPDNSYLNRVLDRRTGNPITLCLVYMLLTRRLRLPIIGIGLPGHFICRFQSASHEIYIDVFNHGRLLTKADCIHHIQTNAGVGVMYDECLAPVTARRLLARICANLHQIYVRFDFKEEALRLQRYLVALERP